MIHVKLAPPTLGMWSMAGMLGQPLEYYYYVNWTEIVSLPTPQLSGVTCSLCLPWDILVRCT